MRIAKTPFEGLLLIEPEVHQDVRGYFFESYNKRTLSELGVATHFVQENMSRSKKNVIRGLHFQKPPMAQAKLVWVVQGIIRDVVVDLRRNQPTYGKTYVAELSSENLLRLFVPVGFAHGFSVMSDIADVYYMCDKYYSPAHQSGIHFRDSKLNIDWGVDDVSCVVSKKDKELQKFDESLYF